MQNNLDISKFENNRSLLIPEKLYTQISNDLMNIFSYNNLYVYNIDVLKKLFLSKTSGGHVLISEEETSDKTSLAELIYSILNILLSNSRYQQQASDQFQLLLDFYHTTID